MISFSYHKTLQQAAYSMQQVCNYVTSSKTSFQGFRLYQDSPFTAFIGIVPHNYCFLEVVTKLNVNQNIFGRLYPVFFHSLCQSSFVKANLPKFGYWMRYRHNNRLKMVQLLKSVDLQDQIISWDSRRRMGHTLDGFPPTAKGIITNWIVRRFGKSLTTTLEWKWLGLHCYAEREMDIDYARLQTMGVQKTSPKFSSTSRWGQLLCKVCRHRLVNA